MSSILKALKKLEQEKSGRFPDSLKIDSAILRTVDSSRSFSPFVRVLLLLLVFGGGAAAAVFFMKETAVPQVTTKSSSVQPVKSITTLPPPAQVKSETLPTAIVIVPARGEQSGKLPLKQRESKTGTGKSATSRANQKIRSVVAEKPVEKTESNGTEPQLPVATSIPMLRVNGIAFQGSAAERMAIVNGTPVSNGSIIEGITVEEVRKDRVLFQRNGEKFEIQLGQSNR